MAAYVLRLLPDALQNPDADLRYVVPAALERHSGGTIRDDAYDYEPETSAMLLWLRSGAPDALARILAFLAEERPLDNDLRPAASVWVDEDGCLRRIWPSGSDT
jgi:hypothetical protein